MMKKILVIFDGSNFYNKAKTLSPSTHLTHFDYLGLAQTIANQKKLAAIYYVGEVRKYPGNKKSEILYSNQQALFSNLRKQNLSIKLGYILFSGGTYHEKGVDVQMAVDLTRGAIKQEYDICYLISSDTDLLPAIKTALDEHKQIIYVGFQKTISRALSNNCSATIILKKQDILKYAQTKI